MAKRASPDFEALFKPDMETQPKSFGLGRKFSWFGKKSFGVIKFILGICLLPFVYSVTLGFLNEFGLIEKPLQNYFWQGVITFILVYLFVAEPAQVYIKGQKVLEVIFNFFKPLVRVAPYLLPIYAIILFILYELLALMVKSAWLIQYFLFLLGFSTALHLVFSAKSVRSKKEDFLKVNYIFGFSFIFIINITLLAFCLNFIFNDFSAVNFFNNSLSVAKNIFSAVLNQLF